MHAASRIISVHPVTEDEFFFTRNLLSPHCWRAGSVKYTDVVLPAKFAARKVKLPSIS